MGDDETYDTFHPDPNAEVRFKSVNLRGHPWSVEIEVWGRDAPDPWSELKFDLAEIFHREEAVELAEWILSEAEERNDE